MVQRKEECYEENVSKLDFTKQEYEYFCEECMFNPLQRAILEDKIKELSIVEISMKHNISTSKVEREVRKIRNRILRVI